LGAGHGGGDYRHHPQLHAVRAGGDRRQARQRPHHGAVTRRLRGPRPEGAGRGLLADLDGLGDGAGDLGGAGHRHCLRRARGGLRAGGHRDRSDPDRRADRGRERAGLSHHHEAAVDPDLGDRRHDHPVHDPDHPPHRVGGGGLGAPRPTAGDDRGLVMVMTGFGLGWINIAADWSRYQKRSASDGSIILWNTLGGAAAPMVLVIFGLLLAGSDADLNSAIEADPIGALITILPLWALIPFWIVAVLTLVSGAVLGIYSSGLTLISLGIRIPRPAAAAVDGLILTAGTIWVAFFATSFIGPFQSFLIT